MSLPGPTVHPAPLELRSTVTEKLAPNLTEAGGSGGPVVNARVVPVGGDSPGPSGPGIDPWR